jgi:hypothetical protein
MPEVSAPDRCCGANGELAVATARGRRRSHETGGMAGRRPDLYNAVAPGGEGVAESALSRALAAL